ncbi:MAG: DegT/DnrJ/EryC1/StrS family aminotransferase [Myxococcales bacterium]|jgi:dTDP-4-amino-4,6-dideoxygalactose transaminase|nr:DegT/DnrJ/EryC1/StrS family aminotransferase [Myxococcales bacterium]
MTAPITLPSDADHSGRDFGDEELTLLREVIASGTLNCTKGTQVKELEKAVAARYGVPYARAVTSGTAAIHCAVAAIDPEPGDEIVTTAITDMGGIAPILYQGAIPIFADVDPMTLNVTPEAVAARISKRTRAVIATHLFGNPCDVAGIKAVADRHGIPVIEDCAQAFLATVNGRLVGTVGAIGAFSLQQGKHMTTGEGGLVITSDPALARHMILFSDKAWGYGDPQPDHYFLALNYRMTDLQGAVARAQLAKLDGVVERRRRSAEQLSARLAGTPGLSLPQPAPHATHVYWKYPLIVDPAVIRGGADALGGALKANGVFCAPRYIQKPAFECEVFTKRKTFGKSRFPYSYREREDGTKIVYDAADYPGTVRGLERVVVLPWNEFYTDEHVAFIASAVQNAVAELTRKAARNA